ncbi:MAG: hypothetical protein MRECE_2c058 [Mycoplasmataceae bacterium CE_OT135]|nr:MAG: hypothetical protein MRECE_2c058 [Mycoplasmataceae bacterium CE_OT135]
MGNFPVNFLVYFGGRTPWLSLKINKFLIRNFWLNPALCWQATKVKKMPVGYFFQFPQDNWGNGTLRG